jgi:hypothetical protein
MRKGGERYEKGRRKRRERKEKERRREEKEVSNCVSLTSIHIH